MRSTLLLQGLTLGPLIKLLRAARGSAVSLRHQGVIDDEVLTRVERERDLEERRVMPDGDG